MEKNNDLYLNNINKYHEKINSISQNDNIYGIPLKITFGNLDKYLKQYGISIRCTLKEGINNANIDEIIASKDYILYEKTVYGILDHDYKDTNAHYLYITDITSDGKLIVSSWGKMYMFDDKNASWTTRLKIKTLTN